MFDVDALVKSLTANKGKRSRQVEIGPSEIGGCRRRMWYRLKGQPTTNDNTLSLAAWMGTAIHSRIEHELRRQDMWGEKYEIEVEVESDGLLAHLKGHVDLYIPADRVLVDWKTTTKKNLSKFPTQQQRWQVQLYGMMLNESGKSVDEVVLVAIPRDGNENDIVVHREPYDPGVSSDALSWLEDVMSYEEPAPADMNARFCKDYCRYYDPSGMIGCEGK